MLLHWIWLAERPSLNGRVKWELVQHFSDPEDIYHADSKAFEEIEGLTREGAEALLDRDLSRARWVLDQCIQNNIHLLTIRDSGYPRRLKNIYDPPILLYYKGTVPDFDNQPAIGIVGTRKCSPYGAQTARRMGYEVAACGGLVVSGLADGIDAAAMGGVLLAHKSVVGILGCGADIVYPRCNSGLFADTQRYGCILSEFAPGTAPMKQNFPRRNRIISGICDGVLVVEAPEKSGSLITARQAGEQGRDVFVVPGNVDATGFVGSNRLLRSGAIAVSTGWDVMSEYEYSYPGKVKKAEMAEKLPPIPAELPQTGVENANSKVAQKPKLPKENRELHKKFNKINIDNGAMEPYIDLNDILTGLTPDEQTVVRAITKREQLVDEVMGSVDMSAGKVLAILTMLELKGKIIRHPGKRVSLAGKP